MSASYAASGSGIYSLFDDAQEANILRSIGRRLGSVTSIFKRNKADEDAVHLEKN